MGSFKKSKGGVSKDQPTSAENKGGQNDLSSHAASASREALENAIKQSTDPKVREAAHLELKRREHQEEGKVPKEGKSDQRTDMHIDKRQKMREMLEAEKKKKPKLKPISDAEKQQNEERGKSYDSTRDPKAATYAKKQEKEDVHKTFSSLKKDVLEKLGKGTKSYSFLDNDGQPAFRVNNHLDTRTLGSANDLIASAKERGEHNKDLQYLTIKVGSYEDWGRAGGTSTGHQTFKVLNPAYDPTFNRENQLNEAISELDESIKRHENGPHQDILTLLQSDKSILTSKLDKLKKNIQKADDPITILQTPILESIEKAMKGGKGLIGEVREWGGKKFKKQANGKWKEVSESHWMTRKEHIKTLEGLKNEAKNPKGSEIKYNSSHPSWEEAGKHYDIADKLSDKQYSDEEVGLGKETFKSEEEVWDAYLKITSSIKDNYEDPDGEDEDDLNRDADRIFKKRYGISRTEALESLDGEKFYAPDYLEKRYGGEISKYTLKRIESDHGPNGYDLFLSFDNNQETDEFSQEYIEEFDDKVSTKLKQISIDTGYKSLDKALQKIVTDFKFSQVFDKTDKDLPSKEVIALFDSYAVENEQLWDEGEKLKPNLEDFLIYVKYSGDN